MKNNNNLWFIHIPKCGGTSVKSALNIETGHQTLLSKKHSLPDEEWENSFSFSFVRNPLHRIGSMYRFLKKHNAQGVTENLSFQRWFELVFVEKDTTFRYREEYFHPAFNWLTLDGKNIHVDFVGKIENDRSFQQLCRLLGRNRHLPVLNRTEGVTSYQPWMKDIVLQVFMKDFRMWYPDELQMKT